MISLYTVSLMPSLILPYSSCTLKTIRHVVILIYMLLFRVIYKLGIHPDLIRFIFATVEEMYHQYLHQILIFKDRRAASHEFQFSAWNLYFKGQWV